MPAFATGPNLTTRTKMASFRRSSIDEKLMDELGAALHGAQRTIAAFKAAIADKHVIIFLGNTRSGKSTLLNYIIDTKLIAFEEHRMTYKIKKADERSEGPTIGQGSQSCTTVPGVYPLNQLGMVIVDAPGFDDNRSEAQDIINALYINQIKAAKTVKFVLVADIHELTIDNIKGFTDLIDKVYSLFPQFERLKSSISIVFTKDDRQLSASDVAKRLTEKVMDVDGLCINKELVGYFVDNPDSVALFRMPSEAGPVSREIDVGIESARVASCALSLHDTPVRVALSSKSRLSLLKIYNEYLDSGYFEEELSRIVLKFNEYFVVDDYVFASTNDELEDVRGNLKHIWSSLTRDKGQGFSGLGEIHGSMLRILPFSSKFGRSFVVLVMIDENSLMEDVIRGKFVKKYKDSLKTVSEKIDKVICKIDKEKEEREKDRLMFNASATVGGVSGGATVAGEVMSRVFGNGGSGWLGILGAAVTAVSLGMAATSYVVESENQKKRMQARARQGRRVYDDMFKED